MCPSRRLDGGDGGDGRAGDIRDVNERPDAAPFSDDREATTPHLLDHRAVAPERRTRAIEATVAKTHSAEIACRVDLVFKTTNGIEGFPQRGRRRGIERVVLA